MSETKCKWCRLGWPMKDGRPTGTLFHVNEKTGEIHRCEKQSPIVARDDP